jgi:hypothetical protein
VQTRWRRRLASWARPPLLLLALVRCPGCCDEECKRVASTEVIPGEVLTAPNTQLQLVARGRDAGGVIIDPTPKVKWQGNATFAASDITPAIVSVATVGDHKVKARMGQKWSPESLIRASQPSLDGAGDVLDVEHTAGGTPVTVWVNAKASSDPDCAAASDRLYTVAGAAVLPENLVGGCANELAIFAQDRAPLIETLNTTQWTTSSETLQRSTLPGVISVRTAAWYFVDAEDPTARATWDLEYANWAHAYNRAGIKLDPVEHHAMGIEKIYLGDENCSTIEADLGFTADASHLHIVYVSEIGWLSDPYGWACPPNAARGDIVIISWKRPLATVVTHEVIHRMGNSTPPFPFATAGHVDTYPGFDGTNLMWSHDDPTLNEDRFSLTLGQIYRVQGATHSWVNRGKLRPPGSTEKACVGAPTGGECPKLALKAWSP